MDLRDPLLILSDQSGTTSSGGSSTADVFAQLQQDPESGMILAEEQIAKDEKEQQKILNRCQCILKLNELALKTFFPVNFGIQDYVWAKADQWLPAAKTVGTYIVRNGLIGLASSTAGFIHNKIACCFTNKIKPWTWRDYFTSATTSAEWQPSVDLATYVGGGFSMEGDPNSAARIAAAFVTVGVVNHTTVCVSEALGAEDKNPAENKNDSRQASDTDIPPAKPKKAAKIADTASALGFVAQKYIDEPGSESGNVSAEWALFFCATSAAVAQKAVDEVEKRDYIKENSWAKRILD